MIAVQGLGDGGGDLREPDGGVPTGEVGEASLHGGRDLDLARPLARRMSKAMKGAPSSRAICRASAGPSETVPSRRSAAEPARGVAISVSASASAVTTPPSARMAWSRPPTSVRPAATSRFVALSWALTSAASGATGPQGRAVVDALLTAGHRVAALVGARHARDDVPLLARPCRFPDRSSVVGASR